LLPPFQTPSDYDSGKSTITLNGVHYYLVIDGYAFDNHHPTGKLLSSFRSGFVVASTPTTTEITIADLKPAQC
jgi:hypothetical protein